MQVEVIIGGKIEAKQIALDNEVCRAASVFECTTQIGQCSSERCAALRLIAVGPEERRDFLARMETTFHRQVDEERLLFTRAKLDYSPGVSDFRGAKQCQTQMAHFLLSLTFFSRLYHDAMLHFAQVPEHHSSA